jgi:hypothetical protein
VVFVKGPRSDSLEDALLVQVQGMIAEYERAQILERTRRGKTHRAKAGTDNVLSGAPFGYRYVRKSEHAEAHCEMRAALLEGRLRSPSVTSDGRVSPTGYLELAVRWMPRLSLGRSTAGQRPDTLFSDLA